MCCFSYSSYSPWLNTPNDIWRGLQIMMWFFFFLNFCYLLPLKPVIFQSLFPSLRPSVPFHNILLCYVQKLLALYPTPILKDQYLLILVATFCTARITLYFISGIPLFHPECVSCCANWWSL
jgi:hypothetical protein